MTEDLAALSAELEQLLRLRSIPFAMQMFADRAEMEAIPRIRRPSAVHTLDQIVGQASRLGWTVGVTSDDLVGAQCRAVVGLGGAKTDAWKSGAHMTGVWFSTLEDAGAHQAAMTCVPDGQYEALAVGPLAAGKLTNPDIALFYATPGAMIYFTNGLQWSGYKRFDWSVVGESACADSWGRALSTRLPSLSIPCFAERRPRRRNAHGRPAGVSAQGHHRHEGPGEKRLPLSLPAIWRAAGCAGRHGCQLCGEARRLRP